MKYKTFLISHYIDLKEAGFTNLSKIDISALKPEIDFALRIYYRFTTSRIWFKIQGGLVDQEILVWIEPKDI